MLAAIFAGSVGGALGATVEVVRDGQPLHLIHTNPGYVFASGAGGAVLFDFRATFPVVARLGEEFEARIRMRVRNASGSGASVVLDGLSNFGLEGGERRMWLKGPVFAGMKLNRSAPAKVLRGEPFELEIKRRKSADGTASLAIRIDDETMLTWDRRAPAIESISLRPARATMEVEWFTITGDVSSGVIPASAATGATEEKRKLWESHRKALPRVDLSGETARQVIIARGSSRPEEYHAHPTTALLADNKTMFAVWNIGHSGHAGPMARSDDAGLTWRRIDEILPPNYANFPGGIMYRMVDSQGKERLWIIGSRTLQKPFRDVPGRWEGWMPRVVSGDDGKTWHEERPLGTYENNRFKNIVPFASIVRLKDGGYLGHYHAWRSTPGETTTMIMQAVTRDGGISWSDPRMVADGELLDGKDPCEPYVFRSPDGSELCCIMRENQRTGTSLMMFSRDEGETWSFPVDTPWGLSGDRHQGVQLPDGRLVIVFRDKAPGRADHFVAWVGTYDDIRQVRPGQYSIRLLRTYKDGCYPGIHLLPDGTIVATTYANYRPDENPSIVSVRFKINETDARAKQVGK